MPAQQRFKADDFARRDIDQRLIDKLEFVVRQRLGEFRFQRTPVADLGIHRFLEETMYAAAVGFRAIERHVGALQQRVEVRSVIGRNGDADRGADRDLVVADAVRLGEALDQPRRKCGQAFPVGRLESG